MSSVSAFISLGRQVNKLTVNQWRLLHPYVYVRSRVNLHKACSFWTNAETALRTIRTSIRLPWQSQEIVDRGRVLTASSYMRRSFSSNGNEENETEIVKESPARKQLKTEDLFRILSLAKPEYKSLAGKYQQVIPSHRRYGSQSSQCDMCTEHDGKVGCNTIKIYVVVKN